MPQPSVIFFDLGDTLVKTSEKAWVPEARQVIVTLASRGLRLGLISNTGDWTREQLLALMPTDFAFGLFNPELVILSSEIKVVKPDLVIFRRAVERTALPANQCVFCGENLVETWAAQQVGMLALRLLPPDNSDLQYLPTLLENNH